MSNFPLMHRYPVENFWGEVVGPVKWHCSCAQGMYGSPLWALGHWLRHIYRWARGRCYYCGDPECID